MDEILALLSFEHSLCLLIAPPAWGKTRLLHQALEKKSIVYFSPLRALAEEFACSLDKRGILVRSRSELRGKVAQWRDSTSNRVLILTPEMVGEQVSEFIEALGDEKQFFVVLDEIHLYFRWGSSFRPILWELLLGVLAAERPVWGLTATVDREMDHELALLQPYLSGAKWRIDCGNMCLKYPPEKIVYYPNYAWGKKAFGYTLLKNIAHLERYKLPGTVLVFVPYRSQVEEWLSILRRQGIHALGCVGGEVKSFVQRLNLQDPPRCIVATTALSHGVNLPHLHSVFIYQKINDPTFWVQMVGRGGRRGEKYTLHTFDQLSLSSAARLKGVLSAWCGHQIMRLAFFFCGE